MDASFVMSAAQISQLEHLTQPEVAFVGRSNVGKSTLLGQLLGKPHLVRCSKTPGRTQLLNVFRLGALHLLDLPGVGYAKLSKELQQQLQRRIWSYLHEREPLRWLMLLVDGRRDGPSADEWQLYETAMERQVKIQIILHKADQVNKAKRAPQAKRWAQALGCSREQLCWCASTTGEGLDELRRLLQAMMEQARSAMVQLPLLDSPTGNQVGLAAGAL